MLRAGDKHELRIMFPMIGSLEELLESKNLVRLCLSELADEGLPHHENPSIGMMVELPSTLPILAELATQSDFFSIGTNDLTQYLLGVDRNNEKVSSFYLPHHPAVLRSLHEIASASRRSNQALSVCGDVAHMHQFIPFLIGIGIRAFSLDADYIPRIREKISKITLKEAETEAKELLSLSSIREISYKMGFDYQHLTSV
jgi:phosphotransferase system enzyme I (PtsP)